MFKQTSQYETRGASRTTGGHSGHQKEFASMRALALALIVGLITSPAIVLAQAPKATDIDVTLNPGDSATINIAVEPGTVLPAAAPAPAKKAAPKADPAVEQKNCVDGGGKWDGTKPVPATQSVVDERCDLADKNKARTSTLDGFAFCNDPDDKALERQVYGEWECIAWKARRADRARTAARIKAAVESIKLPSPVDLTPVTDRLTATEGKVTALETETARLAAEIKAHAEQLARSPECKELAQKGPALLEETAADGTKTGIAAFEVCLNDPKTDPVARVGISAVRVAQRKAEEALAVAKEALETAKRATIAFGGYVGFAGGFQPSLSEGQFILRGDRFYGGELAFALAKNEWRFAGGFSYVSEKGHEKTTDGKFKSTDFGGSAIVVRVAHLWNLQGTRLSGGFTVVARGNSTGGEALGLIDPRARSFTLGGGIGGEYAFTETVYATAALDFATVQVVGGKLSGKPASETGWAPQMLVAVGFRL